MSINHQARKRFGQNFLVDQTIIGQIVAAVAPKPEHNLIEIGPGMAAITEHLIEHCPGMIWWSFSEKNLLATKTL